MGGSSGSISIDSVIFIRPSHLAAFSAGTGFFDSLGLLPPAQAWLMPTPSTPRPGEPEPPKEEAENQALAALMKLPARDAARQQGWHGFGNDRKPFAVSSWRCLRPFHAPQQQEVS